MMIELDHRTITLTPLHGGLIGLVFGLNVMGSIWMGVAMHAAPVPEIFDLARCSADGWVTVRFPGGGEFTCTPTEQKPVASQPVIRKPKRAKRMERAVLPSVVEEKPKSIQEEAK